LITSHSYPPTLVVRTRTFWYAWHRVAPARTITLWHATRKKKAQSSVFGNANSAYLF